jgi:hypothetical protein
VDDRISEASETHLWKWQLIREEVKVTFSKKSAEVYVLELLAAIHFKAFVCC